MTVWIWRWLRIAALLPLCTEAAIEAAPDMAARIAIVDYGTYRVVDKTQRAFDADTTTGYASVINARHLKTTLRVELGEDNAFGFHYAITDTTAKSEWVPVEIIVRHPDTTNYLGTRSSGFSKRGAAHLKPDGRYHNGAFYIFSEPYERVAGEWEISVRYRDQVVATRRFTVY